MILRTDHSSSLERVDYGGSVKVADLSKEDNLPLAPASMTAFRPPPRHRRIPAAALVALRYRCAGELVDVEEVLGRARGR